MSSSLHINSNLMVPHVPGPTTYPVPTTTTAATSNLLALIARARTVSSNQMVKLVLVQSVDRQQQAWQDVYEAEIWRN